MLKETTVVPTITASEEKYREQVERINTFARRVQIDISDGVLAPTRTLDISRVWWPRIWETDLHMIVAKPSDHMGIILQLKPSLCIFHAEVSEDLIPIFGALKNAGIKTGVALLPSTFPGNVARYIQAADHVLVFAGRLGVQGGAADMMQIEKIPLIRALKAEVEIGWDGGANLSNIRAIAHADVNVINVGAALSTVQNPAAMYAELTAEIDKNGVAL